MVLGPIYILRDCFDRIADVLFADEIDNCGAGLRGRLAAGDGTGIRGSQL